MKPSEEYTIKVLSSEDFDNLPYNDARTSLGMTVMKTKTAYIRDTGVKDLDRGTIEHEFDELMQSSSPHEIDGIRYKGGGFLQNILSTILFGSAAPVANFAASKVFKPKTPTGASGLPGQQFAQSPSVSPVTQAFAPQTQSPLGQEDFNTSLTNLTSNAASQKKSIFEKFRPTGTDPTKNSALSRSLTQSKTSSDLARSTFLDDQKKLGSTFV